jgi:hypothetical protein
MTWWREARFGMFIHWGLHAIRVDMFEQTGGAELIVSWGTPGITREQIRPEALFRRP